MKRFICLLALLALLPLAGLSEELPDRLILAPGESRDIELPFDGYWESDAPEVANGAGSTVTGYDEGFAVLSLISPDGYEWTVDVEVAEEADPVPAVIRSAIEIGIREWTDADGKAFPRSDTNKPAKDNKYTKWWGYDCGWCGAFANYCLDMAGAPLEPTDTYKKLQPLADGAPHGVREAAVPKLDTGFTNLNRITSIPQPGYLVIYGRRNGNNQSAYAFVHVGLVTAVEDLGDGLYLVSTVEGNLSNRIKRFTYLYDSNVQIDKKNPEAKGNKNMSDAPADRQTDPAIQYTPHQNTWYVTEFCQTWY